MKYLSRTKFNVGYSGSPGADKAYRENFDKIFTKERGS